MKGVIEYDENRHFTFLLDYDNCTFNTNYVYPYTFETIGDIRKNTSVFDTNIKLWLHILKICRENSGLKKITLSHFSLRQSAALDAELCIRKDLESESYFLAMMKFRYHLEKFLNKNGVSVSVHLNTLLMPDIYNKKIRGYTHKNALEKIDCSREGLGIIKGLEITESKNSTSSFFPDVSKITFVFAQAHALLADAISAILPAPDTIYIIDDREDILDAIAAFYSDAERRTLIPRSVKIILRQYEDGSFTSKKAIEIQGNGEHRPNYAEILRSINAREGKPYGISVKLYAAWLTNAFSEILQKEHPIPSKNPLGIPNKSSQKTDLPVAPPFSSPCAIRTPSYP